MLHELAEQAAIVRQAYAEFDYKTVVATLSAFMNTELSAFYFDIRKDTLYCDPPSSLARKAALTAIDIICDAILRWLAPVLSFTCEEAWRMYRPDAEPSVHLTLFPEGFDAVPRRCARREVGNHPQRPPRRHRRAGARARRQEHRLVAGGLAAGLCRRTRTSSTRCSISTWPKSASPRTRWRPTTTRRPARSASHDVPGVAVVVEKAVGTKCARSWKILPTVGEDAEYPDVSPRDAQALREWKALAEGEKPVEAVEAPAAPVGLIETQHVRTSAAIKGNA